MTTAFKIGLGISTTILLLVLLPANSIAQVAVIAHKSVPMDTIKKSELLDFFSKDVKKWSDGQTVVLFDLNEKGETRESFYKYLGKSASRMKSVWLKKMLLGEGEPPQSLDSEETVLNKVAATNGAIGYVGRSYATADVKILVEIDDSKP
jgi:ABC-type phosphate transport system substrate-binding protein